MIEVLVTIVLLSVGLMGLAALQSRGGVVAIEAAQRTHALLLAQDMLERMRANKPEAPAYAGSDYGTGVVAACSSIPGVDRDRCQWSAALAGAGEAIGGRLAGMLLSGRGCVQFDTAGTAVVIVAWQGLSATMEPALDCGRGAYADERMRRTIALSASLPPLTP